MVAAKENAHTADADKNAGELSGMVAHMEEQEGDDNNNDNGPKIDELRR